MSPLKSITRSKVQSSLSTSTSASTSESKPDERLPSKSHPRPAKAFTMRLFSREKKAKRSSSRSVSSTDRSTTNTVPSSSQDPHESPPPQRESISTFNAARQETTTTTEVATTIPQTLTHHPNTSTSNLSTTSTLLDTDLLDPPPDPSFATTHPHPSTYTTPPSHATQESTFRMHQHERELMMVQAWLKAEERRRASRSWPDDPWRGGFGPPSCGVGRRVGISVRVGEGQALLSPRREEVRGWLGRNGLAG